MSNIIESSHRLSPARKAWLFLRLLSRPALARRLATLVTEGYLAQTGWMRSAATDSVVDACGAPVPWATLPFIDFLTPRLQPHWHVFEFGAGASTLYYARYVRSVIAVEHDEEFARRLCPRLPAHVRLLVRARGSPDYANAMAALDVAPEMASVDGRDRVRCVQAAIPFLALGGVLVLDDSERIEYKPAVADLLTAGFRQLEFWGVAPGRVERKCTSIFYRRDNVLDL